MNDTARPRRDILRPDCLILYSASHCAVVSFRQLYDIHTEYRTIRVKRIINWRDKATKYFRSQWNIF